VREERHGKDTRSDDARRAYPRHGDVLISRLSARVEYQVAIVPAYTGLLCPNEASAVAAGVQLARQHQVDAWLTQDCRHFLKIVSRRLDLRGEVPPPEVFGEVADCSA
jgi:hypothetical protein